MTKGAGSKAAALGMAYKLLKTAEERWRRFNGHELVTDVLDGVTYTAGTGSPTSTQHTTRRSPPERPHATSSTTLDSCFTETRRRVLALASAGVPASPDDWRRMGQERELPPGTTLTFKGYRA